MSKVLDPNTNWYQEIASRDYYYETDLERTIMLYMEVMFPEFKIFPFKQSLLNPVTKKSSAADLGMVKSDYSEWYVIEVELGKHSKNEVITQIETFRNFVPSSAHADYIFANNPGIFDLPKLSSLITQTLPLLMVIVNEDKHEWKRDLSRLSCKMCVFQIYNDFKGQRMYRLDGEYPFISTDFCNCRYEKTTPNTVKLLRKDFLDGYGIVDGQKFDISFNGINYIWERQDAGSEVFLICTNRVPPLDPLSSRYRLNYHSSPLKGKTKWNIVLNLVDRITKKKIAQKRNTFSFVKD